MKFNRNLLTLLGIFIFIAILVVVGLLTQTKNKSENIGTLVITTKPTETIILVDGKEYKDKQEIKLAPGKYLALIKKDAYNEQEQEIAIDKGKVSAITINLVKTLTKEESNFIGMLPKRNSSFDISYTTLADKTLEYTIKLHAINNGYEWQQAAYQEQLASYKKEALKWITSQSIAPETINIKYIPKEAANL